MSSRALSLATVMLLIGCFTAGQARAQVQNLEAGKSPSQIFAGTCSACHKSPRGLLKTVPPGSLATFLRQHYTTSPDMANVLSSYLASNGANDTRYNGAQSKGGKDTGKDGAKDNAKDAAREARSEPKPDAKPPGLLDRLGRWQRPAANQEPEPEPRQAARPEAEEAPPPADPAARPGRNGKRLARPAEPSEDGARERGPDGRKLSGKQKLSKRGRPGGEDAPKDPSRDPFKEFFRDQPKADSARDEPSSAEPPKGDTAKVDSANPDSSKPDFSRPDSSQPDGARPLGDGPSQSTRIEPSRDSGAPVSRPDPVTSSPSSGSPASPFFVFTGFPSQGGLGPRPGAACFCVSTAVAAAGGPCGTSHATDLPITARRVRPAAGRIRLTTSRVSL
jgi:hypothetical protein